MNNLHVITRERQNQGLGLLSYGWGNGYVILPESHPCFGKDFDDIDVLVHGGLTFSEMVNEKLCNHFGLPHHYIGFWMVGFDTAHFGDNPEICDKNFVEGETERLREQLEKLW